MYFQCLLLQAFYLFSVLLIRNIYKHKECSIDMMHLCVMDI